MKKTHLFCLICLALLLLSSCTDSDFTIEGQIDGTPDRAITIAYNGDNGNIIERVMLTEGNRFSFKGDSDDYTLLWIWDAQGQLIAQMVVRDGDQLTVKSDGLRLPTLDITGNDITRQWMKFRKDNINTFDSSDKDAIDRLIEQQIAQHPDQLLSTVLLVAEYNQLDNAEKVKTLLQSLHPDVRSDRLVSTVEYIIDHHKKNTTIIGPLTLYWHNHGIENLNVLGQHYVLFFWSRRDADRKSCIDSLVSWSRQHGDKLMVADILVDTDTTQWSHTLKGDATSWTHWWAPGGIMDPALQDINIGHTPLFIVTDSTAHITQITSDPAQLKLK